MSRLGDKDASIFDEPCINCSRPSTDNTFDPKKLQQAQKTDLQNYADKLKIENSVNELIIHIIKKSLNSYFNNSTFAKLLYKLA